MGLWYRYHRVAQQAHTPDATTKNRCMEPVTQRTTLYTGTVENVQENEIETLTGLLLDGRPVHTGAAIYPDVRLP